MDARTHDYTLRLAWRGARDHGTRSYADYGREFDVNVRTLPALRVTADALFHGDAGHLNPEDLLLAAAAVCHALTYLALCAKRGVVVLAYEDSPRGTLTLGRDGGGRFTDVLLRPRVVVAPRSDATLALGLHVAAGEHCFIARSLAVTVRHEPVVEHAGTDAPVANA